MAAVASRTTDVGTSSSSSWPVAVTIIEQETLVKARAFVLENWDTIIFKFSHALSDETFQFFVGSGCLAFTHADFTGEVFKIMNKLRAVDSKRAIDHARQVFAERGFLYAHAPHALIADLSNGNALLLMEKAKGDVEVDAAKEAREREFERIDSDPMMAVKWQQMTHEVAVATALLGYWDAGPTNFIWDSIKGWSFIDFERLEPTTDNMIQGLYKLIGLFPYQFVDEIYDVADANGVNLITTRENAKVSRKAEFEFCRKRSLIRIQKGLPPYDSNNDTMRPFAIALRKRVLQSIGMA